MSDAEMLNRIREAISGLGTQKDAAEKTGIPIATLQRILAGKSDVGLKRLSQIAQATAMPLEYFVSPVSAAISGVFQEQATTSAEAIAAPLSGYGASPHKTVADELISASDMISIPALNVRACAGDGSISYGAQLGSGPFRFASSWLHREFGSIDKLRMIQIKGDSQLPDLTDGDWVMIDESRNQIENGLAVVLLDDCLMIKRLHREGHFLQLVSRNPIYAPTAIDLSKEEYRLRVIGKAVYVFKSV